MNRIGGLAFLILLSHCILSQGLIQYNIDGFVNDIDFSPNRSTLVLSSENRIDFIDLNSSKSLESIVIDGVADITKVVFIGDSSSLLLATRAGDIYRFDLLSKATTKIFHSTSLITALASSPGHKQLAFGTKLGTLTVLDFSGALLFESEFSTIVSDIKYNSNGRLLAAGDLDGNVLVKDFNEVGSIRQKFKKGVRALAIDDEENLLIAMAGSVHFYRINGEDLVSRNDYKVSKHLSHMYSLEKNVFAHGTYSGHLNVETAFGGYAYLADFSIKEIMGQVTKSGMINLVILGFNGQVYSLTASSMKLKP